jgi:hypothetical protein
MPESNENRGQQCRATTKNGKQCSGYAVAGGEFCFTHSPDHARARAEAHRRGGENRPRASNPTPFPDAKITSARGLAIFIAQLIKDTWTLEPSLNRARTLAYLVTLQKELIERAETEEGRARASLVRWHPEL